MSRPDSGLEAKKPSSSPYTRRAWRLCFQASSNEYYMIPTCLLEKCPELCKAIPDFNAVDLGDTKYFTFQDTHSDAAHTIVHFLYTSQYSTLYDEEDPLEDHIIACKIKTAYKVFHSAKRYGLAELQGLADRNFKELLEQRSKIIPLVSVIRDLADVCKCSHKMTPCDMPWLASCLQPAFQRWYSMHEDEFEGGDFKALLGMSRLMDLVMGNCLIAALTNENVKNKALRQEALKACLLVKKGLERLHNADTTSIDADLDVLIASVGGIAANHRRTDSVEGGLVLKTEDTETAPGSAASTCSAKGAQNNKKRKLTNENP